MRQSLHWSIIIFLYENVVWKSKWVWSIVLTAFKELMKVLWDKTYLSLSFLLNNNILFVSIVERVHFAKVYFVKSYFVEFSSAYIHFAVESEEILTIFTK